MGLADIAIYDSKFIYPGMDILAVCHDKPNEPKTKGEPRAVQVGIKAGSSIERRQI